jgi:hypothetical protein
MSNLSSQLVSRVQPHLAEGESLVLLAFALDDTDVPWWKTALYVLLILLLLPIHIFVGGLPGSSSHDGFAVAMTSTRLLLIPLRHRDGLLSSGYAARKGEVRSLSPEQIRTMGVSVAPHPKEPELRVCLGTEPGYEPLCLLFLDEAKLEANRQVGYQLAQRLSALTSSKPRRDARSSPPPAPEG